MHSEKQNKWGQYQDEKQNRILNPQVILKWNEFTVGGVINEKIQKISLEP